MLIPTLCPRNSNELTQTVDFCMLDCNHNAIHPGTVRKIASNILENPVLNSNKAPHFDTDNDKDSSFGTKQRLITGFLFQKQD